MNYGNLTVIVFMWLIRVHLASGLPSIELCRIPAKVGDILFAACRLNGVLLPHQLLLQHLVPYSERLPGLPLFVKQACVAPDDNQRNVRNPA